MNLFRNSIVVGALCLTAVVLLIRNIPRSRSAFWRGAVMPASSVHPESRPQSTVSLAPIPSRAEASRTVEHASQSPAALETAPGPTNPPGWVPVPRRDPFGKRMDGSKPAAQLLKLQAVWSQTGANLAVINDQVIAEGDRIYEFSVEKIESNHVWLTGPNGREGLTFELPNPEKGLEPER